MPTEAPKGQVTRDKESVPRGLLLVKNVTWDLGAWPQYLSDLFCVKYLINNCTININTLYMYSKVPIAPKIVSQYLLAIERICLLLVKSARKFRALPKHFTCQK